MAYSQSLVSLYQNNFNVVNNISLILLYQTLRENQKILTEETIAKNNHFRMQPLDVEKFVKANNIQEVSNPVFFVRDGVPTADGLLSNEIFGITKDSRANIFAYIDLHGWFLHPLVYKKWSQMDNRIKEIVYGTKKFRISSNGDFIEDENGETGLEFLHKNINKIKIKSTESRKRDANIEFIEKYKNIIFTNKQIVIPAYYRDVDTRSSNVGVGILNKHYASLLIAVRSLKETADYGLDMSDSVRGRIQQGMLNIYNCICGTSGAETDGVGLAQKKGLVRNAVMTKTVDYGSRLVMSAPQLKVEHYEDMMADLDHSSLPLASVITNFKPFIVFNVKRFFENEFGGQETHAMIDANGKITYEKVKDPLVTFSEEEIEHQIKRFIYGFSNRFDPVKVPLENGKTTYMVFKGSLNPEVVAKGNTAGQPSIINRRLTWCDVFYMAAVESVKDKCILITRYPINFLSRLC